ncbi:MAG TPA: acyl carrier protein [Firmicutes bacterium]|jgi:acyl carrier protein|nr:acyl carrier protein [Bacillota bacterium]HAW70655.1 acyl carrier protein [Bacillota bacterium]HAZ22139.1 acyl carrier protein [Bacillota bacterium]HBE06539.1 acyl carrier protein [Bacillota bacterium]HBG45011.1 acyl carrier protein [Bacillota bacterium]
MFEQICEIVAEQLSVEKDQVTMESRFIEDLGADSLDMVELVMAFEEKLGIHIEDEEAENIQSVGDAVKFVEAKK